MSAVDLRSRFRCIRDQKGLESCLALAVTDLVWWEGARSLGDGAGEAFDPSALFLYYNARKLGGNQNHNMPIRPSEAVRALERYGLCAERLWPYEPDRFRQQPPARAYALTGPDEALDLEPLKQREEILRASLEDERPFLFCLRLTGSNVHVFEAGGIRGSGLLPLPVDVFPVRSHAMTAVGYDERSAALVARNSMGAAWGDSGHARVPFDYILDPRRAYGFLCALRNR